MTAEIAVMNKRAIALAADSTVTVGERAKFYNSANKLFMLSKYEPVGIMIYNNAEFMGVPWETLIKEYREYLGKACKDKLEEYADNFFMFLYSRLELFTEYEERYFEAVVNGYIEEMADYFEYIYKRKVEQVKKKLSKKEITALANQAIDEYYHRIISCEDLDDVPDNMMSKIKAIYCGKLESILNQYSMVISSGEEHKDKLREACYNLFTKSIFANYFTGVVFAGFGEKDTFPVLISYNVSGIIVGYLKKERDRKVEINTKYNFEIIPFAQTDTVETFLFGINNNYLHTLNHEFRRHVLNKLKKITDNKLEEEVKNKLKSELEKQWKEVIDGMIDFSRREYLFPILSAVRVLPIDELALMAESLVNLTSFRRRVAIDENSFTVGGPIDVAVISKGDGFVWIKRKHYFNPELNHHFFRNYYENCERGESDEKA